MAWNLRIAGIVTTGRLAASAGWRPAMAAGPWSPAARLGPGLCFDGANFPHGGEEPDPLPPQRSRRERVVARTMLGTALLLLVLPISLSTLVDTIRFIFR